jgi:hypothetical protein
VPGTQRCGASLSQRADKLKSYRKAECWGGGGRAAKPRLLLPPPPRSPPPGAAADAEAREAKWTRDKGQRQRPIGKPKPLVQGVQAPAGSLPSLLAAIAADAASRRGRHCFSTRQSRGVGDGHPGRRGTRGASISISISVSVSRSCSLQVVPVVPRTSYDAGEHTRRTQENIIIYRYFLPEEHCTSYFTYYVQVVYKCTGRYRYRYLIEGEFAETDRLLPIQRRATVMIVVTVVPVRSYRKTYRSNTCIQINKYIYIYKYIYN